MDRRKQPTLIDPARLSSTPTVFEGTVVPGDLERLAESLANDEGELRYRISALRDPRRGTELSCIIEGFVFLTCQSSLDTFRHPVSIDDRLVLVDDESHLPPIEMESEEEDFVVADGPLDVRGLVEDAVILALPMIPRKPGIEEPPTPADKPQRESPFAALKRPK